MTAFLIWGLFPLFWSLLGDVPAFQLLAHRAAWCAVAVWLFLLAARRSGLGRVARRCASSAGLPWAAS